MGMVHHRFWYAQSERQSPPFVKLPQQRGRILYNRQHRTFRTCGHHDNRSFPVPHDGEGFEQALLYEARHVCEAAQAECNASRTFAA